MEGSKLLGIKIRRIRSNLDNVSDFIKNKRPSYVPKLLKIKTADSEMMELLVAPLYGRDPSVGIRELVQNAVDACIELKDLEVQGLLKEKSPEFKGVTVTVYKDNEEGGRLVVEDYGMGMNVEIVEKYFLNIGASFRNSDLWKKNHEVEGKSNVYRTGRFGIGFLAAYLLGDNIRVTTRRVNENENYGLTFQCKKGQPIEVTNCRFRHGTKIEIMLDKGVVDDLLQNERNWDWFCLQEPEVKRLIVEEGGENKVIPLEQNISLPSENEVSEENVWNEVEVNGFESVLWGYRKIKSRDRGRYYRNHKSFGLICNGIFVNAGWHFIDGFERRDSLKLSSDSGYFNAEMPTLVVFDQDGRLPLNLQRTGLSGENPFLEELIASISLKFVKSIVKDFEDAGRGYNKEIIKKLLTSSLENVNFSCFGLKHIGCLAICGDGLLPIDFNLFKEAGVQCLFTEVANSDGGLWSCEEFTRYGLPYLPMNGSLKSKSDKVFYLRGFLDSESSFNRSGLFDSASHIGRKILIRKEDAKELFKVGQVPKYIWVDFNIEWENRKWALYDFGGGPKLDMCLDAICDHLEISDSFGFVVNFFDWSDKKSEKDESPFYNAWENVVGSTYL